MGGANTVPPAFLYRGYNTFIFGVCIPQKAISEWQTYQEDF